MILGLKCNVGASHRRRFVIQHRSEISTFLQRQYQLFCIRQARDAIEIEVILADITFIENMQKVLKVQPTLIPVIYRSAT